MLISFLYGFPSNTWCLRKLINYSLQGLSIWFKQYFKVSRYCKALKNDFQGHGSLTIGWGSNLLRVHWIFFTFVSLSHSIKLKSVPPAAVVRLNLFRRQQFSDPWVLTSVQIPPLRSIFSKTRQATYSGTYTIEKSLFQTFIWASMSERVYFPFKPWLGQIAGLWSSCSWTALQAISNCLPCLIIQSQIKQARAFYDRMQ